MSRYDGVEIATLTVSTADGALREVRYYRRRFPADDPRTTGLGRHTVVPGDRLDLVSFRYTGDPLGFWRIGDANAALDPDALVDDEAVGTDTAVPQPGAIGP